MDIREITKPVRVATMAGDLEQAESLLAMLWRETRAAGSPEAESNAWATLGVLRDRQRRWPEAEEAFRKALELSLRIGDPMVVADRWHSLGVVRRNSGDLEGALAASREVVKIYRGVKHVRLARALVGLGDSLFQVLRHDEAAKIYTEAIRVARAEKLTPLPDLAKATRGLGEALRCSGRFAEALSQYMIVTQLAHRVGSPKRGIDPALHRCIGGSWYGIGVVSQHGLHEGVQAAVAYWYAAELIGDSAERAKPDSMLAQLPERRFATGDPADFRVVYQDSAGHVHVASLSHGLFRSKSPHAFELGQVVDVSLLESIAVAVRPRS